MKVVFSAKRLNANKRAKGYFYETFNQSYIVENGVHYLVDPSTVMVEDFDCDFERQVKSIGIDKKIKIGGTE